MLAAATVDGRSSRLGRRIACDLGWPGASGPGGARLAAQVVCGARSWRGAHNPTATTPTVRRVAVVARG
jgi:hypothetical protein